MKMSAKAGKKQLPPALQKAMEAKKEKAGAKEKMSYGKKGTKKMSITAKKPKVVKYKKKGRV